MWNVICTNQHKWLISENNEVKLRPLTEWPSSKKYEWPSKKNGISGRPNTHLVTSAPYIGGKSPLTPDEAFEKISKQCSESHQKTQDRSKGD